MLRNVSAIFLKKRRRQKAADAAYVRCTIFDVRFGEFPRGARECGEARSGEELRNDARI